MVMRNLWHDIDPGKLNKVKAVVEVPKGSSNKYELNKKTGTIELNRVLYTAFKYPANYGFIPRSYAEDEDPADVLILGDQISSFMVVELRIIGILCLKDGEVRDDKLIGVPLKNPTLKEIKSYRDLPKHFLKEVEHFFKHYKDLEGKRVHIIGWRNSAVALKQLQRSLKRYDAYINNT